MIWEKLFFSALISRSNRQRVSLNIKKTGSFQITAKMESSTIAILRLDISGKWIIYDEQVDSH